LVGGSVGIGLGGATPANSLEIASNAVNGGIKITGLNTKAIDIISSDSNAALYLTRGDNTTKTAEVDFFNSGGSGQYSVGMASDGTSNFYIGNNSFVAKYLTVSNTTGNIGIGTTSPFAKLSIAAVGGDTNTTLFAISSSTAAFATTSLFSINNVGLVTLANLLATGSSTLQNFTFVNATGTSATTTNFFAGTASSTNLYATNFFGGALTTCTGTNHLQWNGGSFSCLADVVTTPNSKWGTTTNLVGIYPNGGASVGVLIGETATTTLNSKLEVAGGAFFDRSTTTSATTTSLFSSTASSTNLYSTNIITGTLTANVSTTSNATTTNFFATTASTTNLFFTTGVGGTITANTYIASLGAVGTPSYTFLGDTNNGFFSPGADITALSTNGVERWRTDAAGFTGFGTSTSQWLLELATSTRPQLALSDASTSNIWTFRNAGGNLYLATSSPSTFATSTVPAFSIIAGGISGLIGIGSSTPWAKLSVEMGVTPALVVANQGSTTGPSLYVGSVGQNGFVGLGTTTIATLARLVIDQTINSALGSQGAIAGMSEMYTFNPSALNTVQVGDRLVVLNNPSTATNTAVAQIIRTIDNSALSNLVRGIEVVASAGTNTYGVNTGIRATGHTFGLQGLTTGNAGGTSTPAAIYGENTGTTQGDVLRLYTSTMTTASSVAQFYQEGSTFSGTGLLMNFAKGSGTFNGNFLDFKINDNSMFTVASSGTTTIGQLNQITKAAGLIIPYGSICVDDDGNCTGTTTGKVAAVAFLTGHTNDVAEHFYSFDVLQPGEIVSSRGGNGVGRAGSASEAIMGVVSTKPGIELGAELGAPSGAKSYPIGLAGRIPVRLSTENGPIAIGDKITISSISGVGMKYDPTVGGTVLGIAIENFDGSTALSQGVIEVQTGKVITGQNCTTKVVAADMKIQGGSDSEGLSLARTSGSSLQTTCTPIETTVAPTAGQAETTNTNTGKIVKIGNALVFLGIDRTNLTVSGGNVNIFNTDLSLENHSILNVKSITSVTGKWSIDEGGNLIVDTIHAKKGYFDEQIEVGTQAKPTGITIYDSVTGNPYCLQMASGVMASTPGKCTATAPTNVSGTTSTTDTTSTTTPTTGNGGGTSTTTDTTTPPPDITTTTTTDTSPPPDTSSPPLTVDTTTQTPTQ
jgi:hypothetical protein